MMTLRCCRPVAEDFPTFSHLRARARFHNMPPVRSAVFSGIGSLVHHTLLHTVVTVPHSTVSKCGNHVFIDNA
ncbi:hypothetical protein L596_005427 [Steinernema carpocapsae]|uniref:Uncharacterized protein n=1 Tax=Steinernema carpocapsae TaxID=34508 RepID=A0A4U8UZ85_STECR|nr:hypothetical protein L596_005427 [Steinernema carpocapsae]